MVLTKLQQIMEVRGITAEELAVKTLMSHRSIENAKKGKGVLMNTGKRIAMGLKMKLEELI